MRRDFNEGILVTVVNLFGVPAILLCILYEMAFVAIVT